MCYFRVDFNPGYSVLKKNVYTEFYVMLNSGACIYFGGIDLVGVEGDRAHFAWGQQGSQQT